MTQRTIILVPSAGLGWCLVLSWDWSCIGMCWPQQRWICEMTVSYHIKMKTVVRCEDVATFSGSSWDRSRSGSREEGGPPNGSTNVSTRATCGRTPYSARTSRTLAGKMVKKSRKDLSYCIIALVDVLFRLCPSNCRGDAVGCSRECVLATGTTAWSHLFGQAWQGRDLWHQGIQILSSAFCWKLVDIEAQLKSRWPNVNPPIFLTQLYM